MSKFSVKKPLTVFVAVIAVLVLGVVAYFKMTPDLLPNMDFPYVMIITAYPGASPEKVEAEVSKPMEQAMSTLAHIKEVTSTSSENASTVLLEFAESVNMDTIGVDIQQKITALSASWEDMVGTPYVLKINPSMLPVEVAAVSMEGLDTMELTEFLDDTLMPKLEGIPGVARISTTGRIQQELHVVLDQNMIDSTNQKIADAINQQLDNAAAELTDQKTEMEDNKAEMENAQAQLGAGADAMIQGQNQLKEEKAKLEAAKEELNNGLITLTATYEALNTLNNQVEQVLAQQQNAHARLAALEELQAQRQTIMQLQAQIAALEAEISVLQGMGTNPEELTRKQEQLVLLQAELAQKQAAYNAALAANAVTEETLDAAVVAAQANAQLADEAVAAIDQLLENQGTDRAGLANTVTETKTQLDQLTAAKAELDAGLVTLEEAEAMLEQQKLTGMLQISTAAGQLAAGAASLEMAITQIDSGLDTLEDSRQDALKQADLNNIITMEMITQILTAQNFAMPAGYVQQDGVSYMVSIGDKITEQETLENLLLFDLDVEGVEPIYLKDVAVVTLTDNRSETYAKLDGLDSVMLSFEKQSTYATAETTANVNARFRELELEYPGLKFVSLMDQGDYIYMVVESILSNLFLGAIFSVLVLFLFLRDIRPTFITLCSIPISVIFAIVLMYFSGVTLNMISLSGLAIAVGMLVDNSVVVIENVYRLRANGANAIQAAVSGAGQVVGAVTASTLTTVCVFLPIVFVEGITRQLFTDLALTMSYALLASLIISLTLVPAMASGMLRKDRQTKQGLLEKRILPAYQKSVSWALNHKIIVLSVCAVLLVVSAALTVRKGFSFMPSMDAPSVTVTVTMPEGADMEQASALADTVLERISALEEVDTVGAMMRTDSSLAGGIRTTSYNVTMYVNLKDEKTSGSAVGKRIETLCADLDCDVSSSSAMMDMTMLTGSGVSVDLYAENMDTLQNAAKKTAAALERLEGVSSVSDGLENAAPALHISIDRNEAMKYGLTVAQIYMELAEHLTADGTAASLELDGISTDVIIEKPKGSVLDGITLRRYFFEVTDQDGQTEKVPLSKFADVEETTSLATIKRVNQRRRLTVTAELEDGYNVTVLTGLAQLEMGNLDLGEGVTYAFTGENETIMEAIGQLVLMLALGILLVYLIMVAQFQSLKSPFIVMFTIPLAFTGGFLALLVCNMEVSVISLIGFVMLVGLIVNNGIVLVDYINQLRLDGKERREAIVEAGMTRMRPILMTTLTTVLGQIVMAFSKSVGSVLMRPITVTCIGGLLYATIMTLYVVPVIYDMLNKKELRKVSDEDLKLLDI